MHNSDQAWSFKDLFFVLLVTIISFYPAAFIIGFLLALIGIPKDTITIITGAVSHILIIIFIYLNISHYNLSFVKTLRLNITRYNPFIYSPIIALLLILFFIMFIPSHTAPPVTKLFTSDTNDMNLIIYLLLAIFIAPISEEVLYRGYIYPLVEKKWGVVIAILSISLFSTLHHMSDYYGAWALFLRLGILGFVLTLLRALTKSTLPSALTHFFYNAFMMIYIFLILPKMK